jgi:hypothetical protein
MQQTKGQYMIFPTVGPPHRTERVSDLRDLVAAIEANGEIYPGELAATKQRLAVTIEQYGDEKECEQ